MRAESDRWPGPGRRALGGWRGQRQVARHSGKCMDLPGASQDNDVQFKQYTCNGGTNQQFTRTAL